MDSRKKKFIIRFQPFSFVWRSKAELDMLILSDKISRIFRFVVYKLPKLSGSGTTGKEFVYIDSESSDWTRGNDINDEQVAVGATISQAYSADKSTNFLLMYSDDDPIKEADSYRGHAKGVSLFDSTTGCWLIHSVPNLPPIKSYSYPSTAEKYEHSFFCSSMEVQHQAEFAEHWKYIQVRVQ